jgi:hypothetical protein
VTDYNSPSLAGTQPLPTFPSYCNTLATGEIDCNVPGVYQGTIDTLLSQLNPNLCKASANTIHCSDPDHFDVPISGFSSLPLKFSPIPKGGRPGAVPEVAGNVPTIASIPIPSSFLQPSTVAQTPTTTAAGPAKTIVPRSHGLLRRDGPVTLVYTIGGVTIRITIAIS